MISPRERFLQIARFERPNAPWIFGLALWDATRHRWAHKGLPMRTESLYGSARAYYMGLENLSIAMYDDPTLVEDIVEWQCTLGCELLKKILRAGITIDVANIFEDMCYKHGSLVSPRFARP